jgi:hypothetical protein
MPRGSAVSEMSPEEMRHALLISEKTGLPNRRAFHEGPFSSGANEAFVNFTLMMIALLALVCSAKALALLCSPAKVVCWCPCGHLHATAEPRGSP